MKKRSLAPVLLLAAVSAFAIQRTPLATIPGPTGVAAIAAQDGILAIAYSYPAAVQLYAIPNWTQVIATLTPTGSDNTVTAAAIENDYIAVGVESSAYPDGSVYIFPKPKGGWSSESQTAILTPSTIFNSGFGRQIGAWGNTLLIGGRDINYQGSAYIFIEPEGGWGNANENTMLLSSNGGSAGFGVALTGSVGSNGTLAVVEGFGDISCRFGCPVAYVYVEPEGGWPSTMVPTATLAGQPGNAGLTAAVSVAESTVAIATTLPSGQVIAPIFIYTEPEGGWVNSSSPNFTASAPTGILLGNYGITLTQNAQVLVTGVGSDNKVKIVYKLAYLWHASNQWREAITLNAEKLTTGLLGATVTKDYAFAWDANGNVFVFDGK
jgi:hypothetical protein